MTPAAEHFRGYPGQTRRIAVAGRVFEVLGPANYESLIDEPAVVARFEQDEYLPYWAEFWPAAVLLAEAVAGGELAGSGPQPSPAAGHGGAGEGSSLTTPNRLQVLELGCGLGLGTLVALHMSYDAVASDYDQDALAFVIESARRNGLPPPRTRCIDWRERYPDLRVDRIIAAEILYEARHIVPVAQFIRRHLAPGGWALICDAHRPTADAFPAAAAACHLRVAVESREHRPPGGPPVRGRLFRVWATAASDPSPPI